MSQAIGQHALISTLQGRRQAPGAFTTEPSHCRKRIDYRYMPALYKYPNYELTRAFASTTSDGVPAPAKYSIGASTETSGSLISDLAYDFSELSADKYDSGFSTLYVTSEKGDGPISNCAMVKLQDEVGKVFRVGGHATALTATVKGAVVSASKASENVRATLNEISATAYSDVKAHFVEKFGKKVEIFDDGEPVGSA